MTAPMRSRFASLSMVSLLAATVALAAPLALAQQAPAPDAATASRLVFVVNAANRTAVTADMAREIYRGERRYWPDGTRIVLVVTEPGTREHQAMTRVLLGFGEPEFRRLWDALRYQGEAPVPPYVVPSGGAATRFVERVAGAIGYAWEPDVTPAVRRALTWQ